MTNEELQEIINIGDICHFDDVDKRYEFIGYWPCQWQESQMCRKCKGTMKFVSNDLFVVGCHSNTNGSDITIVQKGSEFILSEELFEI